MKDKQALDSRELRSSNSDSYTGFISAESTVRSGLKIIRAPAGDRSMRRCHQMIVAPNTSRSALFAGHRAQARRQF